MRRNRGRCRLTAEGACLTRALGDDVRRPQPLLSAGRRQVNAFGVAPRPPHRRPGRRGRRPAGSSRHLARPDSPGDERRRRPRHPSRHDGAAAHRTRQHPPAPPLEHIHKLCRPRPEPNGHPPGPCHGSFRRALHAHAYEASRLPTRLVLGVGHPRHLSPLRRAARAGPRGLAEQAQGSRPAAVRRVQASAPGQRDLHLLGRVSHSTPSPTEWGRAPHSAATARTTPGAAPSSRTASLPERCARCTTRSTSRPPPSSPPPSRSGRSTRWTSPRLCPCQSPRPGRLAPAGP